jgi:hypothetical protein
MLQLSTVRAPPINIVAQGIGTPEQRDFSARETLHQSPRATVVKAANLRPTSRIEFTWRIPSLLSTGLCTVLFQNVSRRAGEHGRGITFCDHEPTPVALGPLQWGLNPLLRRPAL